MRRLGEVHVPPRTLPASEGPACRSCGGRRLKTFLSLGELPLPDALVKPDSIGDEEERFPLDVAFCPDCTLVQILGDVPPEKLFVENYLYFSSFSDDLLDHARSHATELIAGRALDERSLVVELASNDGYLLRNFVDRGIPVLGIDPAPDQAAAARQAGVPTLERFFGADLARELREDSLRADVIVANNVMAHVPDLNGFAEGIATLLADDGVATIENPYVRDLIAKREFDTIYHEHFCYFSCSAVDGLLERHGLWLNDIRYFPELHGGTLRWYASRQPGRSALLERMLREEQQLGMADFRYYEDFAGSVDQIKARLLDLLVRLRAEGKRIAAYGAAAKGAILTNATGIDHQLVEFVVDRNPHKHGLLMPGSRIPIRDPSALLEEQPDVVLMLAWNFTDEIVRQQSAYVSRGGRFIIPIPEPSFIPTPG